MHKRKKSKSRALLTYKSAGVSLAANDELVRRLGRIIKATHDPRVLDQPGGFSGSFRLLGNRRRYRDPVLVASSDGVGSKVLLAAKARQLDTIGVDLVAMNVNDLLTCGAEPLFFLDYIAVHHHVPAQSARLVRSMARGCRQADCALLGGETAEMPGVYRPNEFDLAGFAVGVVEREKIIRGQHISPGDVIIGLASTGLHANGFALVHKALFESKAYRFSSRLAGLQRPLIAELLRPTRIYVRPVLSLLGRRRGFIKAMAHVTGGGLPGNLPRILPKNCRALIRRRSWKPPAIFRIIQSSGVPEKEMYRVFNMGIGMALIVEPGKADTVLAHFKKARISAAAIGLIQRGRRSVQID